MKPAVDGPRRWGLGALAGAMVALVAIDAWADWKTAYAEGYTLARQGKNWERVAVLMQEALQEKKDEGSWVNVTSGGSQPYLPYFYLGLARFNLGDCRGAVDNWRTASSYQQFLQHKQQNELFRDLFPICEKDVDAQKALADARARRQEILQLGKDPDLAPVWAKEPGLGPALAQAEGELSDATRGYDEARAQDVRRRLGLFVGVQQKTAQLNDRLEGILKAAQARRDTLATARKHAEDETNRRLTANTPPNTSTGLPPNAGGDTRTTPAGNPALPAPSIPAPPNTTSTTRAATEPLEEAPRALVSGTNQLFNGDYREALTTLAGLPASPRWQGHSALVRSAAAYALYSAGGQRDRTLLQQATDAARECQRARPGLEPDARWFSPRFVQFFRQATATREQAVR